MRLCATFIVASILALPPTADVSLAGNEQPTEYQLKAAYIYHFAQFVDWPAEAFPATNSPLIIGILGDNPFGDDLNHVIQGKVLNGHAFSVKEFRSATEITNNCHILFISSSVRRLPEVFASLKGTSILTVGESDRFTEMGGMINFVVEGSKIRFQINETTVEKAGLKISFKLLSLASQVTH